ncbi:hypothetical protein NIES4074_08020 [Cylindrospermum sp. NIES-4074]|nr:hypothetical protein NIES4074_08020 [Cylindrospermum sp. NIES-4074]
MGIEESSRAHIFKEYLEDYSVANPSEKSTIWLKARNL